MKTLEQTILEASNPHYGIMGEKTKAIASAVREWMKEQNEGLRNIIDSDSILKAAKYDELRAKFSFLPGEEFWTLFQHAVCRWTVEKVWFNSDDKLCLKGYRQGSNGSLLESPNYRASECHPTVEACRAAIKVEE